MGLLTFLRDAGKDLFTDRDENPAAAIKEEVESALGDGVSDLGVRYDHGRVTLVGTARSGAVKENAALVAGNVQGVTHVDHRRLRVVGATEESASAAGTYYTVQAGDTLTSIAEAHYGDPAAAARIFEANRETIGDLDAIFPGQQIRLPA